MVEPHHTSALSRCRCRSLCVLLLFVILIFFPAIEPGLAANEPGTTTITLGASNDEQQREDLFDFFGVTPDVDVIEVTAEEAIAATNGIFGVEIEEAYSSTAFTCRELGQGLDIATINIDLVTPALYALALVTAGVGDGQLVIAAPRDIPETGISALTGIFKMWQLEPCTSGVTNPARQRLAQEQLALTVQIGQAFEAEGLPDGVGRAATMVLEAQKQIINGQIRDEVGINRAVGAQERAQGFEIFEPEREELIALFVRIANSDIDWSTFSEGWSIEYRGTNRVTMRGEGIAIRNAQATATAEAEATVAAERTAIAGQTATAEALTAMTATAQAEAASDATATAEAALTATSRADATATIQAQATAAAAATESAATQATAAAEARRAAAIAASETATAEAEALALDEATAAAEATAVASAANSALATADARATSAADATAKANAAATTTARFEARATESALETAQADATLSSAATSAAMATSAAEATTAARATEIAVATAATEATALAQATANALATAEVVVILTQTASTRPTETPVLAATPAPWTLSGNLVDSDPTGLTVAANGDSSQATRLQVDPAATILRDGEPAGLETLSNGDRLSMTIDGASNVVTDLNAESVAVAPANRLTNLLWLLPFALAIPAFLWLRRRNAAEPFVVKRIGA